jgi:hypothetical protein
MAVVNRASLIERNRQAAQGVKDNLKGSVQLDGNTYKVQDILNVLGAPATAADTTDKSKAAWRTAVATERTAKKAASGMRSSLQSYLVGIHGKNHPVLAEFGFVIKAPPAKTVEVKNEAAVKMRATRTARGTMGPKQKAKIKGTVEIDPAALAALKAAAGGATNAASTSTAANTAATTGAANAGSGAGTKSGQ